MLLSICRDDVPVLAFGPTIFHGAWCVALFVGWMVLNRPSDCKEGSKYTVALAGLGFTFLINFVLGILLMHEGLKGKPMLCSPAVKLQSSV